MSLYPDTKELEIIVTYYDPDGYNKNTHKGSYEVHARRRRRRRGKRKDRPLIRHGPMRP